MTNRDLYLLVQRLQETFHGRAVRSLEEYLRALWSLAAEGRDAPPSVLEVSRWIEAALSYPAPPFQPSWQELEPPVADEVASFAEWQRLILSQVADLHQMDAAGQLDNEYRFFGLQSPAGRSWFNFDVFTYLECGIRGALGGYQEEDAPVPPPGEPAEGPTFAVPHFSWGAFAEILLCGQIYE